MRAELANLNQCAVPFLSRAAINLSWYDSVLYSVYCIVKIGFEVSTQRFFITATIVDLNQGCPIRGPPVGPLVKSPPPNFTVSFVKSKLDQKYAYWYETAKFDNGKGAA